MRETGCGICNGLLQILQVLKDELIRSNILCQLLHIAAAGNQLGARRHINSVDIRKTHRGCGRTHVDLLRALLPNHRDDLADRRPAHNRVVHQQHVFALECLRNWIQLAPN